MPEINNIEQIGGHGTTKVDAVIPKSGEVSPLFECAICLAILTLPRSRFAMEELVPGITMGTTVCLLYNWIQLKILDAIHHTTETAVARGGAPKIDAVVGAFLGGATPVGYVAGLTPRANAVVPDWRGATLLGAFLGGAVGLRLSEFPSTRKNALDYYMSLKETSRQLMEQLRGFPRDEFRKVAFPRIYASGSCAVMGGVFLGSYCGLHNSLAKKRGVEDGYNHLVANCAATASIGCLPMGKYGLNGTIGKRIITMMTAFAAGCAIASTHLKKVD